MGRIRVWVFKKRPNRHFFLSIFTLDGISTNRRRPGFEPETFGYVSPLDVGVPKTYYELQIDGDVILAGTKMK